MNDYPECPCAAAPAGASLALMTTDDQLCPPAGILPGQLGIILLGRVVLGDIAATLTDLAQRQLAGVTEAADGKWLLNVQPGAAARSLAGYETTVLRALPLSPSPLSAMTPHGLDQARAALIHDGVARGWLHHLHHDQRTDRAEELAPRLRSFQRALRHARSGHNADVLTGDLLPWALHFGLISRNEVPLARFADAWVHTFAGQPGCKPPERPLPVFDEVYTGNVQPSYGLGAMMWAAGM
jgi:hypothetical protein